MVFGLPPVRCAEGSLFGRCQRLQKGVLLELSLAQELYLDGLKRSLGHRCSPSLSVRQGEAPPYPETSSRKSVTANASIALSQGSSPGIKSGVLIIDQRATSPEQHSMQTRIKLLLFCSSCSAVLPQRIAKNALKTLWAARAASQLTQESKQHLVGRGSVPHLLLRLKRERQSQGFVEDATRKKARHRALPYPPSLAASARSVAYAALQRLDLRLDLPLEIALAIWGAGPGGGL